MPKDGTLINFPENLFRIFRKNTEQAFIYLIKSGGGTGPVKPDNRLIASVSSGAKSCGISER